MSYIKRNNYLEKVKPFINKQLIKVLSGQRRVGKSYILLQLIDYIKDTEENYTLIYIDKESFEFDFIKDYTNLYNYVKSKSSDAKNYLFIDEIQEIKDFQKALRSLLSEGIFDIYCTGSNAYMLSSELSTLLSGRYIEIKVHSLSYQEFLLFHRLENNEQTLLNYLKYGGLPFLIHLPFDEKIIFEYLKNIYNTIFFKDIISRFNIRNVSFLNDLAKFLAHSCGSIFSASKISNYLNSQKIKTNYESVLTYLNYLESAYFIHRVKRYDIQGKRVFEIGEKIFFDDMGIRNSIAGFRASDIAKIMENAVLLHLLTNDYEVAIGVTNSLEIDFIGTKNNEKIYIQVAYLLENQSTIDREFGNLLKINDNYPKYVVSMDKIVSMNTHQGIQHLNLQDFLMRTVF